MLCKSIFIISVHLSILCQATVLPNWKNLNGNWHPFFPAVEDFKETSALTGTPEWLIPIQGQNVSFKGTASEVLSTIAKTFPENTLPLPQPPSRWIDYLFESSHGKEPLCVPEHHGPETPKYCDYETMGKAISNLKALTGFATPKAGSWTLLECSYPCSIVLRAGNHETGGLTEVSAGLLSKYADWVHHGCHIGSNGYLGVATPSLGPKDEYQWGLILSDQC